MPRPARADRIAKSAERRLALVIAASCLAGCIGGMPIALDAWRSEVIIAAMQSGSASARGDVLERFADIAPGTLPDRAEAALAQIALAEAGDTHEQDLRQLCLARASQLIGHLRFVRPIWAPSLILSTELAVAAEAPNAPVAGQALADYAASYRAAPFLRQEARWRIALAARAWVQLDRATRQHAIDEAVWLTHYDNAQRAGIEADFGDSPAGVAYQLALTQADAADS